MKTSGSRYGALKRVEQYLEKGDFEEELSRRVQYRTESQIPNNVAELHRYLDQELIPSFTDLGFDCEKFDNPIDGEGPFLLASRIEDSTLPTVLGYGHGDVVFGQDNEWDDDLCPWQVSKQGDRLYGRGTADNKAQHTINIAALGAVIQERGSLGFNAKYLIEMGEETGSVGLGEVLSAHRMKFHADVFIGSDGPRISPQMPTITLGSRGAINFDLSVDLREGAHHSGNWGGLIADPAIILSHALASITTPSGQLLIKEWLPPPTPDSVKQVLNGLVIDTGPGAPSIEMEWGEPGLESTILSALRTHLDKGGFEKVKINVPEGVAGFAASRTEPDHPWVTCIASSIKNTIGTDAAIIPSMGGSICNDLFTDLLELPAIWIPHSYAACSQHAPNEHILLSLTDSALRVMAGLYWDIGDGKVPA